MCRRLGFALAPLLARPEKAARIGSLPVPQRNFEANCTHVTATAVHAAKTRMRPSCLSLARPYCIAPRAHAVRARPTFPVVSAVLPRRSRDPRCLTSRPKICVAILGSHHADNLSRERGGPELTAQAAARRRADYDSAQQAWICDRGHRKVCGQRCCPAPEALKVAIDRRLDAGRTLVRTIRCSVRCW